MEIKEAYLMFHYFATVKFDILTFSGIFPEVVASLNSALKWVLYDHLAFSTSFRNF
jgi:hypothetical protein